MKPRYSTEKKIVSENLKIVLVLFKNLVLFRYFSQSNTRMNVSDTSRNQKIFKTEVSTSLCASEYFSAKSTKNSFPQV